MEKHFLLGAHLSKTGSAPKKNQERTQLKLGAHLGKTRSAPRKNQPSSNFNFPSSNFNFPSSNFSFPSSNFSLPSSSFSFPSPSFSFPSPNFAFPSSLPLFLSLSLCLFVSLTLPLFVSQSLSFFDSQFPCRVQCRVCVGFLLQTLHNATCGESARYEENVGFYVGFAEFFSPYYLRIDTQVQVVGHRVKAWRRAPLGSGGQESMSNDVFASIFRRAKMWQRTAISNDVYGSAMKNANCAGTFRFRRSLECMSPRPQGRRQERFRVEDLQRRELCRQRCLHTQQSS